MNVGSNHRVSNDELRAHFEEMGFVEVSPFRASGNVVFTAGSEPPRRITARIEDELAASLGYQVATFLRGASEVRAIAGLQPFPASEVGAAGGKLQVSLLSEEPSAQARTDALTMATRVGVGPEGSRHRARQEHPPNQGDHRADRGKAFHRAVGSSGQRGRRQA
jgi:uncharacterized protein (DUF1697 family)